MTLEQIEDMIMNYLLKEIDYLRSEVYELRQELEKIKNGNSN